MRRPAGRRLAAGLLALGLAQAACGQRGNPLPPLRLVPAPVTDLTAHRVDDRIELAWTIPAANTDGSTPGAVTRLEIYAASSAMTGPDPAPATLVVPAQRLATIPVRSPSAPAPAETTIKPPPSPGDRAMFVERLDANATQGVVARHYVVVPVAGTGPGRPGTPSDVATVPVAASALPAPPGQVAATFSETDVIVSWEPAAKEHTFRVLGSGAADSQAAVAPLTPAPIAAARFTQPVEFGRERCFAVRALSVVGRVTLEGPPGPPVCVTPMDRFPPPAPANLQAIQEGAAVTLVWTGVTAADLAGYVVLRGDGAGENMQPLVAAPVQESAYRDAAVQPGGTYVYAVYAQDKATPANVSQLSNRQTVTVR